MWILLVLFQGLSAIAHASSPIVDYVFSQQGCKDALWEFDDGLNFTRNTTQTACANLNGFEYWTTGAYTTDSRAMDGIVSSLITDQFEELTSDNPDDTPRNITLVLWFTLTQLPSLGIHDLLVEFSPSQPGTEISSTDVGPESYQPKVQLRTGRSQWVFPTYNLASSEGPYTSVNLAGGGYTDTVNPGTYMILTSSESTLSNSIHQTIAAYSCNGRDAAPVLVGYGTSPDLPGNQYLQLLLDPNNRIRMGSSRYPSSSSNYIGSINTWFHRFAVWNRTINEDEQIQLARYGVPVAIASARNTTFELNQDEAIVVNLNTSDSVGDVDGDAIISIRVLSLPFSGSLEYNETEITELPFELEDPALLVYIPEERAWSYPDCSAAPTFQFDCSDNGVDYNLGETYALLCIIEVNVPPVAVSANLTLPKGSSLLFTVLVTDENDQDVPPSPTLGVLNSSFPSLYRNTTFITWQNQQGEFGEIMLDDCSTPVVPLDQYRPSISFCYVSTQDPSNGQDTFFFKGFDAVSNSTEWGVIGFEVLNPLQAYGTNVTTYESPETVNFALPLFDGLDRTPLEGQVVSLPSFGTLTHNSNDSAVEIGDIVDGNLTYEGDALYFNRFTTGTTNFYGEPTPPADSFLYLVRYENETSETGTIYVNVINTFSEITSVSGLTGGISMAIGGIYEFGTRIQIDDPDDEEYLIGVSLYSTFGSFIFQINQTEILVIGPDDNSLILGICGPLMDAGCSDVTLAARPRYVNYLLSKMTFQLDSVTGSLTKLTIGVFKPSPAGMTEGNFARTFLEEDPFALADIPITTTSPTSAPGSSSSDPTLLIVLIVSMVLGCVGALCFICLISCVMCVFAFDRVLTIFGWCIYYATCQCLCRGRKTREKLEDVEAKVPLVKSAGRVHYRPKRPW
jgi:hypothetical protein